MSSAPRRDLCDSAKRGKLCCDDLCHTGGETLCGFDLDDYRDICEEWEPEYQQQDDEEPTYNDLRYQQ